jgi:hypothetical protein
MCGASFEILTAKFAYGTCFFDVLPVPLVLAPWGAEMVFCPLYFRRLPIYDSTAHLTFDGQLHPFVFVLPFALTPGTAEMVIVGFGLIPLRPLLLAAPSTLHQNSGDAFTVGLGMV